MGSVSQPTTQDKKTVRDKTRNRRSEMHRKKRRDNQAIRVRRVNGWAAMQQGFVESYRNYRS
jgi:hypothetical protein